MEASSAGCLLSRWKRKLSVEMLTHQNSHPSSPKVVSLLTALVMKIAANNTRPRNDILTRQRVPDFVYAQDLQTSSNEQRSKENRRRARTYTVRAEKRGSSSPVRVLVSRHLSVRVLVGVNAKRQSSAQQTDSPRLLHSYASL